MSSNKEGIDIQQALEILAERSDEPHSHADEGTSSCHHNAPKEAAQWGQRIDLGGGIETKDETSTNAEESIEVQRVELAEARAKRRVEIETKLNSVTVKELLNYVINSQQQRVATYRTYDSGLDELLKTGNMTNYPNVCAEATASFSVLSESINAVQKILLEKHDRNDLASLITKLQKAEKDKLNFTAALHLERIRAQSQEQMDNSKAGEANDTRIAGLLKEGVASLQGKVASTVEEINETLEELRYAFIEESEESK